MIERPLVCTFVGAAELEHRGLAAPLSTDCRAAAPSSCRTSRHAARAPAASQHSDDDRPRNPHDNHPPCLRFAARHVRFLQPEASAADATRRPDLAAHA